MSDARDVLTPILASTRRDVAALQREPFGSDVEHAPIDVVATLRRSSIASPLRLIAEIKHRSPSAGALSSALSVAERARAYEVAGASMISVLVDREHFGGSYADLASARAATSLPVLCKGFVVDRAQVDAAKRAGADAVLLIARVLDAASLRALHDDVTRAGLTPIVEVVDDAELATALDVGAKVIGVNARDLATLEMNVERAQRLLDAIPSTIVSLHFSGLKRADDVRGIAARRRLDGGAIDGALVGEALMRLDDPTPLLRSMRAAADVGTEVAS